MPGLLLLEIFSFSILIAAIIGAVRFKVILKSYRPFVYLMWIGLATEIIDTVVIIIYKDDTVINNIYTLFVFSFFLALFFRWFVVVCWFFGFRVLFVFGVL